MPDRSTSPTRFRPTVGPLVTLVGVLAVVVGIGVGAAVISMEASVWVAQGPLPAFVAVVLATATAIPYSLAVLWIDRNEREPWWLLLGAFIWGAVAATAMAGLANAVGASVVASATGDPDITHWWVITTIAPITEEIAKAAALAVVFTVYRHHADNALDGLVYGALVGLGFAWFENIAYYVAVADEGYASMAGLAWLRGVVSGVGTHATFTGIVGVGFGVARVWRSGRIRLLAPLAGLVLAMAAHAVWNAFAGTIIGSSGSAVAQLFLGAPLAVAILQLPFLSLLAIVLVLSWRQEDRIIRHYLALEPADVVDGGDIEHLLPARRRFFNGAAALLRRGPFAWWQHMRLTNALVKLAFERWHHQGDAFPWSPDEDQHVRVLRGRIRRLRSEGARVA